MKAMDFINIKINYVLGWISHKWLNGTILFSGVTGTIGNWLIDNWQSVIYFLGVGMVAMFIKIAKFRQEMRHSEELHALELQKLRQEITHANEKHQMEVNETPKSDSK